MKELSHQSLSHQTFQEVDIFDECKIANEFKTSRVNWQVKVQMLQKDLKPT